VIAYRIHPAGEPLATMLDPHRPDGWTADDESSATQPLGVSACTSLLELARYTRYYSMAVQDGDQLVELSGRLSPEPDRDEYAVRWIVTGYRVIADGATWRAVVAAAAQYGRLLDDLAYSSEDYPTADDTWRDYLGAQDAPFARQLVAAAAE